MNFNKFENIILKLKINKWKKGCLSIIQCIDTFQSEPFSLSTYTPITAFKRVANSHTPSPKKQHKQTQHFERKEKKEKNVIT